MASRRDFDRTRNERLMMEKFQCREAINLDALPNEGTGHIDLFAKFLDDHTVAVSRYNTSDVVLFGSVFLVRYRCTAEQIATKDWDHCAFASKAQEPLALQNSTFTSLEDGKNFETRFFDAAIVKEPYSHPDLPAFSTVTAEVFANSGFSIVWITAPQPELRYGKIEYLDRNGEVIRTTLERNYIHRSFANALILNGHIYVPSYDSEGAFALHPSIQETYKNAGFTVHFVDMDASTVAGGAAHCLSMELH